MNIQVILSLNGKSLLKNEHLDWGKLAAFLWRHCTICVTDINGTFTQVTMAGSVSNSQYNKRSLGSKDKVWE